MSILSHGGGGRKPHAHGDFARPEFVTGADLAAFGLHARDVRRCPGAVEYAALDGSPCWSAEDLTPLFRETRKGASR